MSTFENFKRILDKTGDLKLVLSMFDPRFNPVKNPNLTLYDRIDTDNEQKVKVSMDDLKIPLELKNILKSPSRLDNLHYNHLFQFNFIVAFQKSHDATARFEK